MPTETYEVNGQTFQQHQRVNLWCRLNNGSHKRISGTLYTVRHCKAFIDTAYGTFEGDVATLESEED